MDLFVQQVLNGLTIGMIYALIALGYTMVYGVIQLINFAHGEVFMVGAYLALTLIGVLASVTLGAPLWVVLGLVFALAMAGAAGLGAAIERVAYRPLRDAPRLAALITAIGMSFFLQNAVMLIYGSKEQTFPEILPETSRVLIFLVPTALMFFLTWFIRRTRAGRAMRACAENPDAARLMGVSVDRVIRQTFMIGSALAAMAGVLFGMTYGSINFHDGYLLGLKAFTAAVFGGIGSIPGAMIGGVLLGVFEGLGAGYLSSEWKDVFAFLLLGIVLVFKPSGLLGENIPEKV